MADKENVSFETAIERLTELVGLLENGKAPLDRSLEIFEEGVHLIGICKKQLENAEQKVKLLTEKQDGSVDESDFDKN
jgi:exodeoxyribonuclease VII small subunit